MDANSHTRRDHRIGIARPLHHYSHRCIRTALTSTVNHQSPLVARLARNRIGGAIYGPANYGLLIPPGTQNTQQGREKKPLQICGICNPLHTPATPELSLVAGAGVSGSSPLVDSPFCCGLQEKRKSGRTPSSLSYSNRTATRAWLRTILRPQEYIAYSLSR